MNDLKVFNSGEFGKVRTLMLDSDPWFVGKDVAEALGYSNASKAVMTHVEDEDKQFMMMDIADSQNGNVPIGKTKVAVINESGLYCLIFSSKLESAKRFKRWVTSEVLPELRKTGSYGAGTGSLPAETYLEAARMMVEHSDNPYVVNCLKHIIPDIDAVVAPAARKMNIHDLVLKFVEMIEDDDLNQTPTKDVYESYVEYCADVNFTPVSRIVFSKCINQLFMTSVHVKKLQGKCIRVFWKRGE